ncbi:MAG: hypothetical protein D6160_11605 [Ketobacter sp.]|nr:MAG: hypothetical protein D6160_11605 [Ketobacter sp.]
MRTIESHSLIFRSIVRTIFVIKAKYQHFKFAFSVTAIFGTQVDNETIRSFLQRIVNQTVFSRI